MVHHLTQTQVDELIAALTTETVASVTGFSLIRDALYWRRTFFHLTK
jgi:hypothetical protein